MVREVDDQGGGVKPPGEGSLASWSRSTRNAISDSTQTHGLEAQARNGPFNITPRASHGVYPLLDQRSVFSSGQFTLLGR